MYKLEKTEPFISTLYLGERRRPYACTYWPPNFSTSVTSSTNIEQPRHLFLSGFSHVHTNLVIDFQNSRTNLEVHF